ncbi:hypothetical protein EJ08DRAFT_666605 [Tothia fuscella]|uniref:Uncharacterized protein n=1 Tax=Tothia fuscella TaxID=1048955 RepID=A0A9P4NE44_9PEZI|nr:hypothetical protein EJ08DRAFT_666605 [Tothia fuscella]
MQLSVIVLSLVTLVSCVAGNNEKLMACECDAPSCPAGRLDTGSLCACLNNAALFCWKRNGRACASPILPQCGPEPTTAAPTISSPPPSTYTPPYQGLGGLNCVEIGYCSRPKKERTSMTVTVNGVPTVITVPVGLPTPELSDLLPPNPNAPPRTPAPGATGQPAETPIIFTPITGPGPTAAATTTPELSDLLPKATGKARMAKRVNEARWMGM